MNDVTYEQYGWEVNLYPDTYEQETKGAVERGLSLLTERGWTVESIRQAIVARGEFDMMEYTSCVLGGCYGTYTTGRESLELGTAAAAYNGFDIPSVVRGNYGQNPTDYWACLQHAWEAALDLVGFWMTGE